MAEFRDIEFPGKLRGDGFCVVGHAAAGVVIDDGNDVAIALIAELGTELLILLGHDTAASGALLTGAAQAATGVVVGFVIGIVAALLGVAGGELLIPTLVLLFGADLWSVCR